MFRVRLLACVLLVTLTGESRSQNVTVTAAPAVVCSEEDVTFELATGFVLTSPEETLETLPGTLQLKECIETCRRNSSCLSLNFETGLCVLFKTSAQKKPEALTSSQFPVYTMYAQRACLPRASQLCTGRPWAFEFVPQLQMPGFVRDRRRVASRTACMELCLQQRDFQCRSASYNEKSGECALSDMDRFSVTARSAFVNDPDTEYFESNCVDDPVKMCDFQRTEGRILKTVDAVYEDVEDVEGCKKLCLNADFRCHSFDFGDTGDKVCRLSHHSTSSLSQIQEPYLEVPTAATHELTSCYNVTIDCRSTDMIVKVKTNRIFNGKLYSKTKPNSCVTDVSKSLEFELRLGYQDVECDVQKEAAGKYFSEVVIQHHDQIVTSQDLGLALRCTYQLQNYSVSSGLDLSVASRIPTVASESTVVPPPTVRMRITARDGSEASVAQVGDPLSLRFEIVDRNSPYEIFVRDLVAFDGKDNNEIILIDSRGCPTDSDIMGAINKVNGSIKTLEAPFDAFKFPTSDVVQFKALVTPCLPSCEPVNCQVQDYLGFERRMSSLGRRKRRETNPNEEDLLVIQSIRIEDKFQFPAASRIEPKKSETSKAEVSQLRTTFEGDNSSPCLSMLYLLLAGALFLVAQAVLIGAWAFIWQKRRQAKMAETTSPAGPEYSFFPSAWMNLRK